MRFAASAPGKRTAIAAPAASVKIPRVILRLLRAGLRRVFNLSFLAALSLLLGIGLGCLWERSMRVNDWLSYYRSSGQNLGIRTAPGGLWFYSFTKWGDEGLGLVGWQYGQLKGEQYGAYQGSKERIPWHGFTVEGEHGSSIRPHIGYDFVHARIPLWFPMLLTLIAPLCWLRRWRRQARRVRLGLCLHCGYDLRATPEAAGPRLARCPECGRLNNRT